jgi:hypothetical protein
MISMCVPSGGKRNNKMDIAIQPPMAKSAGSKTSANSNGSDDLFFRIPSLRTRYSWSVSVRLRAWIITSSNVQVSDLCREGVLAADPASDSHGPFETEARGGGLSPPVGSGNPYPDPPKNSSLHCPAEMTGEWKTNEWKTK